MSHAVLNDDWSEYDNRKIRGGADRSKFACTESWEVDHLVKIYRKRHPEKSETSIRQAIASCCQSVQSPHPRKQFVECVSGKLGI